MLINWRQNWRIHFPLTQEKLPRKSKKRLTPRRRNCLTIFGQTLQNAPENTERQWR
nr:MAG TPA: hypothetical protein [Caudoviricetes sp.]